MNRIRIAVLSFLMVVSAATGLAVMTPAPASAASCPGGNARLITFPAWYNGLVDDNCNMKPLGNGDNDLRNLIARITLNIVEIILQLVAYATIVFLLKGGFDYMTSTGDASKISNAKKTIEHALIGLVIALASVGIVNLVAGAV